MAQSHSDLAPENESKLNEREMAWVQVTNDLSIVSIPGPMLLML